MQTKPSKILRLPVVVERTSMCKTVIYQKMARAEFPAAIKFGPKHIGWLESEIDTWIDERVRASRGQ
jgi:prophage regulatory protein